MRKLWMTGGPVFGLLIVLATGCNDPCPDGACDEIPDDPWVPVDDDDDDATGYGDDDTGDDDDDDDDDATEGDDDDTTPDVVAVRDCVSHLSTTPGGNPSSVRVAGEWNGFDGTADPAEDPDNDGTWTFDVELPAGEYAYKYVVDGDWQEPPVNRYTKWYGGSENRNLRVGDCMQPLLQTVDAWADGSGTLHAEVQFASAADEVPIDPATVLVTVGDLDVTADVDVGTGVITIDASSLPPGKHSVRVWAADDDGRDAENQPLFIPLWIEDEDFEWRDATMYFVFTDRFRNGDRVQLWVDEELYVYGRDAGNGEVAVVAMNKGWSSRTETIDLSALGIDGQTLADAVGGGSISVAGNSATISLDSWEYAVYLP